jgi:hypothetical protein
LLIQLLNNWGFGTGTETNRNQLFPTLDAWMLQAGEDPGIGAKQKSKAALHVPPQTWWVLLCLHILV